MIGKVLFVSRSQSLNFWHQSCKVFSFTLLHDKLTVTLYHLMMCALQNKSRSSEVYFPSLSLSLSLSVSLSHGAPLSVGSPEQGCCGEAPVTLCLSLSVISAKPNAPWEIK